MKVRIAYLEEPPFYWTAEDGSVKGADIELAEVVLRAAGASAIEYQRVAFDELLLGVQEDRWDMNVPIFVTPERAGSVAFSTPVWALADGLLLRHGNPKALISYESVAARNDARLGIVAGTVQLDAAKSAGVNDGQILAFKDQPDAIDALLTGTIDAYASTAVGSRTLANAHPQLEVATLAMSQDGRAPVGAFSFSKRNTDLLQAVNDQLRLYLGSDDHRARMAEYGLTRAELDSVSGA
jgi:polar amino acid transport system substrate-binding protein